MNTERQPGLPWSPAQDEQLRILVRANTSPRDIADRMGRRPESVFRRAHALGLLSNPASTHRFASEWRPQSAE